MKKPVASLLVLFLTGSFAFVNFQVSAAALRIAQKLTEPSIFYVLSGGTSKACSSWDDACELHVAIALAKAGDEIWVGAGTYTPVTIASDPREATFALRTGVAIYGGFPETGGEWTERDLKTNLTILSGDIEKPDNSIDNSYHVVTGNGVNKTAILDGFTISSGNANGTEPHNYGGGMYNELGNPTLTNLTFTNNSAVQGGGMYNNFSSPTLTNVTFSANSATYDGGGGVYNFFSSPTITNVTFSNNTASIYGGGMYNMYSSPVLTNVTFSGNSATWGGGISNYISSPTLTNAILWDNTPDQISNGSQGSATITYSVIQGGYTGDGNISDDPLLGPLADYGGFTQTHALDSGSPAIDTGNPTVCPVIDQRAYARPIDGDGNGTATCDMGAFEFASYPATYKLTIDIVGYGSVAKEPDKTDHLWGEEVTLTPTADPGWSFGSWSGATVTDNILTITSDTTVIANFTQNEYTLTVVVDPAGSGTVTRNPDYATYHYGDEVILTATATEGRIFSGWGGDASGSESPLIVKVFRDTSITANFTYRIHLPLIVR